MHVFCQELFCWLLDPEVAASGHQTALDPAQLCLNVLPSVGSVPWLFEVKRRRLSDPHLCCMTLDKPGWGFMCSQHSPGWAPNATGGLEYTQVYPHLPSKAPHLITYTHSALKSKATKRNKSSSLINLTSPILLFGSITQQRMQPRIFSTANPCCPELSPWPIPVSCQTPGSETLQCLQAL